MPKSFDCPKCGAPVDYMVSTFEPQGTVRCNYCNSTLTLPDELHGQPARVVSQLSVHLGSPGAGWKTPKWLWLIFAFPLLGVLIGLIAMAGAFAPLIRSLSKQNASPRLKETPGPAQPKDKETSSGLATTLLRFGSEGIGPGMFTDARSIAVDGSGNIYVGEYMGGRVQVFDPTGKFITQWSVDPKMPLRGLAADGKGTVYIVQGGGLTRWEGLTGKRLGQLATEAGGRFDDVTAIADGGLLCASYANRDDIVRLDVAGKVARVIRAAISSTSGNPELDMRLAIDGLGNIYALGRFNQAVFKFGPDGRFVTRIGARGHNPGQFSAPSAIAVDGRSRVFVSDTKGIQVFDTDGRYLDVFKSAGHAAGMVFNDQNELFLIVRTEVIKVAVAQ